MNRTRQDPNSRSASPMFAAIARTVIAHPWCTIASWLVGVAIVLALAPSLATYTTGNNQVFLPNSFESVQAQNVGNKYFSAQSGATGALVVSRQDSAPLSQADQTKASQLATSLENDKIPAVVSVKFGPGSVASNQSVATLQVAFAGQPGEDRVNAAVGTVRTKSDAFLAGSGLEAGLTGNAAIQVDTTNAYDHANKIITIATVVVIFLLLGLIFRSLIIAHPAHRRHRPRPLGGKRDRSVVGRGIQVPGRQLADVALGGRAVRDRDRLHRVPAVPIPRTTAKGCPPQGGPDLLLLGGREGRGLLGVDRCRSVCCTIPGEARVS